MPESNPVSQVRHQERPLARSFASSVAAAMFQTDPGSTVLAAGCVDLPVKTYRLLTQQVSLTNPVLPQQMFLGEAAFTSMTDLEESLVHELSHIWSSLIAEVYDFQRKDSSNDYVLPSGTGGKNPRGVLLACLFAVSALNYHQRLQDSGSARARPARVDSLHQYFRASLVILQTSSELSEIGRLITSSLEAFANGLISPPCKDNP